MLSVHLEVLLPLAVSLQGAGEVAELSCHPKLQPHQDLQGQLGVWPSWLGRGVHMDTPWVYIVGHNATTTHCLVNFCVPPWRFGLAGVSRVCRGSSFNATPYPL